MNYSTCQTVFEKHKRHESKLDYINFMRQDYIYIKKGKYMTFTAQMLRI